MSDLIDKGAEKPHVKMRDATSGKAAKRHERRPAGGAPAPLTETVTRLMTTQWKIIAGVAVACVLLAWVLAAIQPRRYRASAIAAVAPLAESLSASEVLRGVEVLERRTVVATVAALASTARVREEAVGGKSDDFRIDAAVLPNTNLFRVNVEGTNRARVAEIANRVPSRLSAQTRSMFKYYTVTTVSPATAPGGAFFPRTGRAIATGLLLGLFLGVAAAYVAERRSLARPTSAE